MYPELRKFMIAYEYADKKFRNKSQYQNLSLDSMKTFNISYTLNPFI